MARRRAASHRPEAPAAVAGRGARRDPVMVIGLIVLVAVGLRVTGRHAVAVSIPFADTHTYLEPARNLLAGRGFVTEFNVVYGWSGERSHPGLAYYNPLYGLGLGIAWQILKDPGYLALVATVLPCLINVVLLAVLVRPALGRLVALLSAAGYLILPSTYVDIALISAEHPLITLCLVLLLMVQRLVPRGERYWIAVGVALGVSYLVKVTVLAAAPALMAGLLLTQGGGMWQRLRVWARSAVLFVVGIAVVLVPFNVVCRIVAGNWYPEYPLMARNWSVAELYGGHFVEGSPAIRPDVDKLPAMRQCFGNVADNVQTMLKASANELGLLALAVVAGLLGIRQTRSREAIYLFCMGGAFLVTYAAAYHWFALAREPGSPARYALHVASFWYPLGVAGVVCVVNGLRGGAVLRGAVLIAIWILVSLPALTSLERRQIALGTMHEPRVARLQRTMAACRELTEPDDLVAVAGGGLHICGAMFLERPVVPLPQQQMDNEHDTRRFMELFEPKLVIPGTCRSAWQVVPRMGYQAVTVPATAAGQESETVFIRPDGQ